MVLFLKSLNERLSGAPDTALTFLLLLAGVVFIVVALFGPPLAKVAGVGLIVL